MKRNRARKNTKRRLSSNTGLTSLKLYFSTCVTAMAVFQYYLGYNRRGNVTCTRSCGDRRFLGHLSTETRKIPFQTFMDRPQFTLVCPQRGPVRCQWQPNHNLYLATSGANNRVTITDKRQPDNPLFSFDINGQCSGIAWNQDGDILAVVQESIGTLYLWDSASPFKFSAIESNWKGLQLCCWSDDGNILACGSQKGNLLLYHRNWSKKVPILGKHKRAIIDMAWLTDSNTHQSFLVCLSEDQTFTVSNKDGDTLIQTSTNGNPQLLRYSLDVRYGQPVISFVTASHTLCLANSNGNLIKTHLFPTKYGNVVGVHWFKDALLVVFSSGIVIEASASADDFGTERQQMRHFKDHVVNSTLNEVNGQLAILGDHYVKVIDAENIQETITTIPLESERGLLEKVHWSSDGQYLTVSSKSGRVNTYLNHLPAMASVYQTQIVTLCSLNEMAVFDVSSILNESHQQQEAIFNLEPPSDCLKISTDAEPLMICAGPCQAMAATNNSLWSYNILHPESSPTVREFPNTIQSIAVNRKFYAVAAGGRVYVGKLNDQSVDNQTIFPSNDKSAKVLAMALTEDFLITGTEKGNITHYLLRNAGDQGVSSDFIHDSAVRLLEPNTTGAQVLFFDSQLKGYMYNAVDGNIIPIPMRPNETAKGGLWRQFAAPCHRQTFLVHDGEEMRFFAYTYCSIKDENLQYIGKKSLPHGLQPILFYENFVVCLSSSGKLVQLRVDKFDDAVHAVDMEKYLMGDMKNLWKSMHTMSAEDQPQWKQLALQALSEIDLKTATKIYRFMNDLDMLYSLQLMSKIEDKNLLYGHIAVALSDFGKAQEYFLASSKPLEALNLRCDLLQWDESLQLASKLAPEEVPVISVQYAQHMESHGHIDEALETYKKAVKANIALKDRLSSTQKWQTTQKAAEYGLARTTLRSGDIPMGMRYTQLIKDQKVLAECASILEGLKQMQEAAFLYEKAKCHDKAAELYIKVKNYTKVGELLANVQSPKIHFQYAKAKESEGHFEEAIKGYEKAKDYENLVRILVENLRRINEAVDIVRSTKSPESAKIVAKYFQSTKDYKAVIEFCLLAGLHEEALSYAQNNDQMDFYARLIEKGADKSTLIGIATYFEQRNQFNLAGKYFMKAGDHGKAIVYLLQTNDPEAIEMAIELAGTIKSETLTAKLLGFLNGDRDGIPKDKLYIFKLNLALEDYKSAVDCALDISNTEQVAGRYRQSRDVLFNCCQALQKAKIKPPLALQKKLALVHSYVLVKPLIKMDDHERGARMLIRVATSISHFPLHSVAILTSTVIECHRSGMKRSAFEFASTLVRPEYRNQIDPKFKRKIELIVRRPENDEVEEKMTPCPFCTSPLPESCLDCTVCKSTIPFCIASGSHMVRTNWSFCPSCQFPALFSQFKPFIQANGSCPMCDTALNADQIQLVDANAYLKIE